MPVPCVVPAVADDPSGALGTGLPCAGLGAFGSGFAVEVFRLAGRIAKVGLWCPWLSGKGCDQMGDQGLAWTGRCESDPDAGGGLNDAGTDFDQAVLQGGELGAPQGRCARDRLPYAPEKPVGGGMKDQAELVGGGGHAGGAVAFELGLVQLDHVLGLTSGAIVKLVKPFGRGTLQ